MTAGSKEIQPSVCSTVIPPAESSAVSALCAGAYGVRYLHSRRPAMTRSTASDRRILRLFIVLFN